MICPQCGAKTPDGSSFCKACGTSLVDANPISSAQPPAASQPQPASQPHARQAQLERPAPAQDNMSVNLTRFLIIVAISLSLIVVILIVATVAIHSNASNPAQVASSEQATNARLADAYSQVLDNIQSVEFVQGGDETAYDMSGAYRYTLIDLRDDGTPDLLVTADATAHTERGEVDCTLTRVMVFDEESDQTVPIGNTIHAGSSAKMVVTPDLHGIAVRSTDPKTGRTLTTRYTLKEKAGAEENAPEQEDTTNEADYHTPNLVSVDDRSLIDRLREGTWSNNEAIN